MKCSFTVLLLMPLMAFSQAESNNHLPAIASMKYSWITASRNHQKQILTANIFEGSGRDMEYLALDASIIRPAKSKTNLQVPPDEEHLLIIKSGTLILFLGDSTWTIGAGSVALLLPGENFSLQGVGSAGSQFYTMKYRSKNPPDPSRGRSSGGSFVRDWNKLPFHAHDRGGVRRYFEKSTTMSKRFEMHVTTLKPGLKSHEPHTHNAEEIILMLEDTTEGTARTEMLIGDRSFQGRAGDLYYVGSNLLHGIKNIGTTTCSYFAFQFE